VKYKNASSAKKMLGELIDVLGPGLGISSGDIAGGLVGALLETMFRMHWNVDGVFPFPVKDWVEADAWVGTIRVTQSWIQNPPGHASNEHGLSVQTSSSWVKKLNLTVALDGSMVSEWGQAAAITASSSDVRKSSVEQHWSDVCHSASNLVPYSIVRRGEGTEEMTKTNYRGTAMVTPIVDQANGTIHYNVGVGLALGEDASNNGIRRSSGLSTSTGCDLHETENLGRPDTPITITLPLPNFEAFGNPKQPDKLEGRTTQTGTDYSQTTEWSLRKQ
jgi:hypothetical protein